MKTVMRRLAAAGCLAVTLSGVGCQTYQLGQALPSPYHMRDDIQYIPKGPDFPLQNELNAMQEAETQRGNTVR